MTRDELGIKFRDLVVPRFGEARTRQVADLLKGLESAGRVTDLMNAVGGEA